MTERTTILQEVGQGDEAQLVDDQELVADDLFLQAQKPAFVSRLHQFVDQRRGGGEANRQAFLAGGQTKTEGDMGLAGSTGPEGDDVLAPVDPFAARKFQHLHLVQLGDRLEVEAVEALGCRELRGLDAAIDHPPLTVDQLEFDQTGEELDMIQPLGGTLARQFLVFPQEGGQLERLEVMGEQDLGGLGHSATSDISDI